MVVHKKKTERDIEKEYPLNQFVEKLRRLADCLEQGKKFRIQIDGVRLSVPPEAIINIEHERGEGKEGGRGSNLLRVVRIDHVAYWQKTY